MTTAYYIQDSPFHARWVRDGEMGPQSSELEVEKSSEEKVKGRDSNSRLGSSQRILKWTGPKWNAELSFTLTLQATGANSSPMYLLKLQNYEQHKY